MIFYILLWGGVFLLGGPVGVMVLAAVLYLRGLILESGH